VIRGKQNKAGPYTKRPTDAQLRAQSETAYLAAAWNRLAEEQRQAWCATARVNRRSGAKAGQRRMTGRMLFFRVNSHRLALRLPLLAAPPELGSFVSAPLVQLVITNAAGRIALKLRASGGEPTGVMVSSYAPLRPGTMSWRKFVRLGFLPAPVRGICDITRQYVARYGVPAVGSKIFVRVQQMKDYVGKSLQITSAVVPGEADWAEGQNPL
jgi:hypothetical protein